MQTIGINNKKWYVRLKWISYIFVTLIMGGFATVLILFFCAEGLNWAIFPGLFQGLVG